MATNIPFTRGLNCKLRMFQDGRPVYIAAKNWDENEEATEIQDDVNGEDRSRLDKVTNFFSCSVDIFQRDQELMDAIIAAQEADDAAGLPLTQSIAVQIANRDGTRSCYLYTECKFGPWKKSASGRSDAYMQTIKIRARYMRKIPTI